MIISRTEQEKPRFASDEGSETDGEKELHGAGGAETLVAWSFRPLNMSLGSRPDPKD